MTITEFLLARIAEDEANLPNGFDCWYPPDRYEAECEAKRRIVKREADRLDAEWRGRIEEHRQTFEEWFRPPYGETLRDLASIYADHPDYDPNWRP